MESDNNLKFYTPSIEEFHFGFEYELACPQINEDHQMTDVEWKTSNFTIYDLRDLGRCVSPNDLDAWFSWKRVKYLSQSDIESFGFKFTNKSIDLWFEIEGWWDISGGHRVKKYILHYGLHDNRMIIEGLTNSGDTDTFFEGYIKNKNELKQLLTWLKISTE